MNIEIRQKGQNTSWEELTSLFHEAFQERLDQGLQFTCSFFTPEDVERISDNNLVIIAIDKEDDTLAGTASFEIIHDETGIWAYHSNLAIKPDYKRYGIATKILEHGLSIAKANGCNYMKSDTAVEAKSSVKWHLRNGFRKYELFSFPSTNYYSYIFRKQLEPKSNWSDKLYCDVHFWLSSIKCRMCFHSNGERTKLMSLYLKARGAY